MYHLIMWIILFPVNSLNSHKTWSISKMVDDVGGKLFTKILNHRTLLVKKVSRTDSLVLHSFLILDFYSILHTKSIIQGHNYF